MLGMLIDRTSFDETDDYGVDQVALEPAWSKITSTAQSATTTIIQGGPLSPGPRPVMRDGKVRRRLRWRPKVPKTKKQQQLQQLTGSLFLSSLKNTSNTSQPVLHHPPAMRSTSSCNSSVMSGGNVSQTSKQSKKSLHSFASTETAAMSNLKKDKIKQHLKSLGPLPRPAVTSNQSTIGTEGGFVQARMVNSSSSSTMTTPTTTLYEESTGESQEVIEQELISVIDQCVDAEKDDCRSSNVSLSEQSSSSPVSPRKQSSDPLQQQPKQQHGHSKSMSMPLGLPPLFKRKPFKSNSRDKTSSSSSPPPRGDASVVSGLSIGSFPMSFRGPSSQHPNLEDDDDDIDNDTIRHPAEGTIITTTTMEGPEIVSIDVDDEPMNRQVDLRIARTASASEEGSRINGSSSECESHISDHSSSRLVDEIRSSYHPKGEIPNDTTHSSATPPPPPAAPMSTSNMNPFLLLPPALKAVFNGDSFLLNMGKPRETTSSDNDSHQKSIVLPQQPTFYGGDLTNQKQTETSSYPTDGRVLTSSSSSSVKPEAVDRNHRSSPDTVPNPSSYISAASSESVGTSKSNLSKSRSTTGPVDVDDGAFLEAEKNLHAIHEMAIEHLEQGEYNEALEVFEEILRGQLARYGEDHYRVGTALHNIGVVHMRRGDYTNAILVYKEAVRVRKMALEPDHLDIAVSLAQLGVAYLETNRQHRAIGTFREALKIRRKCLGNHHPKVAKILNNIGCALYELNELHVARVAFEEAREIQRHLLRSTGSDDVGNTSSISQYPSTASSNSMEHDRSDNAAAARTSVSETSLLSIASTQSNIASIKLHCGEYEDAIIDFEEALLIQQCVLGDDHPLARRTQESLLWLENQRSIQLLQQNNVDGCNHEQPIRIERTSDSDASTSSATSPDSTDDTRGPNNDTNTPSSFSGAATNVYRYCKDQRGDFLLSNSVFDSIERGFRRLHADLDFMSCGVANTTTAGVCARSGSDIEEAKQQQQSGRQSPPLDRASSF